MIGRPIRLNRGWIRLYCNRQALWTCGDRLQIDFEDKMYSFSPITLGFCRSWIRSGASSRMLGRYAIIHRASCQNFTTSPDNDSSASITHVPASPTCISHSPPVLPVLTITHLFRPPLLPSWSPVTNLDDNQSQVVDCNTWR